MKKKIAVAYARFSSEKQREESIMHQIEMIEKYCSDKGVELVKHYIDEARSGTNTNRESFQLMMMDAKYANWDYVMVYKMDRLSRNVSDALNTKKELNALGIQIISVIEDFDTETPEGGFFNLITMGMSEFYIGNLRRGVIAGQMQNARSARATGGKPLFGYRINKELKYEIEPKEAKAVRLMFDLVLKGYSYIDISKILNEKGYVARSGKPFRGVLTDYLRNRKYIGEYSYNKIPKRNPDGTRNSHLKKPENEIIRIPNAVPKIIDEETFNKVQAILDQRRQGVAYIRRSRKYLLTGLTRCDLCGHAVVGMSGTQGQEKRMIFVYGCSNLSRGHRCPSKRINMKKTDHYVLTYIQREILNQSRAKEFTELIKNQYLIFKHDLEIRYEELKETYEKLNFEIEESSRLVAEARRISKQMLMEHIHELGMKKEKVELELMNTAKDLKVEPIIMTAYTKEKMKELARKLKVNELDHQREVLAEIIRVIVLSQTDLIIKINLKAFIQGELITNFDHVVTIDRDLIKKTKKSHYKRD